MAARHVIGRSVTFNDPTTDMKSVVRGLTGTKKAVTIDGAILLAGADRGTFTIIIQSNGASDGVVDWGTIPEATHDAFNENWYAHILSMGLDKLINLDTFSD